MLTPRHDFDLFISYARSDSSRVVEGQVVDVVHELKRHAGRGSLFAHILPMFKTGAAKYASLNNVVAAGVYRPRAEKMLPGYQIL